MENSRRSTTLRSESTFEDIFAPARGNPAGLMGYEGRKKRRTDAILLGLRFDRGFRTIRGQKPERLTEGLS